MKLLQNYSSLISSYPFDLIQDAAEELGIDAYVIGGFVRDKILDRKDPKDIDIVTTGDGIELAKKFAQLAKSTSLAIFKTYGTAQVKTKGFEVEFVGTRKESYTQDSRNPSVTKGTLKDDQNRRDFTINALAIQLEGENRGDLIDPFEGIEALKTGIIKTPLNPDITYSDDPLRMMRAIRFATQLSFEIEPNSFSSIQNNAERLKIITQERVLVEFNKILLSPKPSIGLLLLHQSNLLQYILPEIEKLKGVEKKNGISHKDNFYHTFEVVDNLAKKSDNLWLRWAALLHDVGKAPTKRFDKKIGWTFHNHEFVGSKMVRDIFKRLKLPLDHRMKYVRKMVMMSSRPIPIAEKNATDSAVRRLVFDAGEDIMDLLLLCEADITTKNELKYEKYLNNYQKVRDRIKEVEERDHIKNFQPPISGEEIMSLFDLKPCKEIGLLKNAIKEAILEGEIPNQKEDAHNYLIEKANEIGLKIAAN